MKGLMDAKQNGIKLSSELFTNLETVAKEFNLTLP